MARTERGDAAAHAAGCEGRGDRADIQPRCRGRGAHAKKRAQDLSADAAAEGAKQRITHRAETVVFGHGGRGVAA